VFLEKELAGALALGLGVAGVLPTFPATGPRLAAVLVAGIRRANRPGNSGLSGCALLGTVELRVWRVLHFGGKIGIPQHDWY